MFQCSKSCEGGFRVREVRCLSDDMAASTQCDPQLKPEEKELCNTQDCVPEIGKAQETSVLTMELHLVEKLLYNLAEALIVYFLYRVQSFIFTQNTALFCALKLGFQ